MKQDNLLPENKLIVVYDGFGSLMGVGKAESRRQAELLISDICEEWFEHCRGDVILNDDDWSFLLNNTMNNVSITIITGADDEIEITTTCLRDYTHYKNI
jgi:hypothetical protein